MSYKLITFDFTGTLMRFRIPPAIQYEKVAHLYGIKIKSKEEFQQKFKTAFQNINKAHPNFGASTNLHWTQWWLSVVRNTFINAGVSEGPNLDAVAWHLIKLYGTTQGWEIIPGVEKILYFLKHTGQRIGVISNMDPRLNNILNEAGLRHYFEFVLPSYDAKFFKPQSDIFKIALEKCSKESTRPIECCHIGDSYNEDYLGATSSGWNAILVNQSSHGLSHGEWCSSTEELYKHLLYLKNTTK